MEVENVGGSAEDGVLREMGEGMVEVDKCSPDALHCPQKTSTLA